MLGFHADGIRLFGASDTLVAALKKHKLPLVKTSTTNTLVFAVNTAEPLTKKLYLPSFLAPQAPWFSCFVGDAERPAEYSLHFAAEEVTDMTIGAVITAAGMSSRMGDFKPMMNIGSISIAHRVIATLKQAGAELVVVKLSSHPVPNTAFTHVQDRQAFAAIAQALRGERSAP